MCDKTVDHEKIYADYFREITKAELSVANFLHEIISTPGMCQHQKNTLSTIIMPHVDGIIDAQHLLIEAMEEFDLPDLAKQLVDEKLRQVTQFGIKVSAERNFGV